MNKLVKSLQEVIALSGLRDGMTVSFHHHLRNGDYVLNMVMDAIANAEVKDNGKGEVSSPVEKIVMEKVVFVKLK